MNNKKSLIKRNSMVNSNFLYVVIKRLQYRNNSSSNLIDPVVTCIRVRKSCIYCFHIQYTNIGTEK